MDPAVTAAARRPTRARRSGAGRAGNVASVRLFRVFLLFPVFLLGPVAWGQDEGGRYGYRPADGEPDAVDARFPQDPERVRQLRAVRRAADAGDWDRAADGVLFLLGEAGGEVVRLADGSAARVADEADRLLAEFPAAERDALRRRLAGAADAALAAAGRDAAALREVAVAFPLTDAAARAADRLAALHLERGEPGPAARLFGRLLADDPPFARDSRWRARAAAAFARAGDAETARSLWDGLNDDERAGLGFAGADFPPALAGPATPAAGEAVGDPLPVAAWAAPVVADPDDRAAFAEAAESVDRAGAALLPVWRPVGAAGAVFARTTDGVLAVDAATGAVRWRTPDGGEEPRGVSVWRSGRDRDRDAVPGGSNPVVSAMARDAAAGTLSTDGVRLFVLERDDDGTARRNSFYGGGDAAPVRLAAYRLVTGRRDWEVGGEERGEVFDLPLAGWRVLGVPAADGGDLFCVAERVAPAGRKRIALFCLNPATGEPRWDRTLAFADASIQDDPVRAEYGAHVAVGGGVVVAPSSVGWVSGVDRLTRETLWVARAAEPRAAPQNRRGFGGMRFRQDGTQTTEREPLGEFWSPGPPRVAGGAVVFAPPGEDRLFGFDLLTGEELWRPRRRRPWFALAGTLPAATFAAPPAAGPGGVKGVRNEEAAAAGAAVLVGEPGVAAVSLGGRADRLWLADVEASGLPVVTADRVFVPVAGGGLVTLDAATGAVRAEATRGEPDARVGTLAAAGGRLVSLGPGGLVGFEDEADLAADLAAAAPDPGTVDPGLALRAAERLRTTGAPADVLAALDRVGDAAALPAEFAERRRSLERRTLRDAVLAESDPARRGELLDRLDAVAGSDAAADADDARVAAARLRAFTLHTTDPAAAVAVWRGLLTARTGGDGRFAPDPLVPVGPAGEPPPPAAGPDAPAATAEARLSRVAGRALAGLHAAGGAGRDAVDALAAELLGDGPAPAARPDGAAAGVLPDHPAVAAARLRWDGRVLNDPAAAERPGDAGRAELDLHRLAAGPAGAARDGAEAVLASLEPAAPAADGAVSGQETGWGAFDVVAEALPPGDPAPGGGPLPAPAADRAFFRSHRLTLAAGGGRVDVTNARGAVVARFPLRGGAGGSSSGGDFDPFDRFTGMDVWRTRGSFGGPAVAAVGGVVFVVSAGSVAAVHPESGGALWDAAVPGADAAGRSGGAAFGLPARGDGDPVTLRRASDVARGGRNRPRLRGGVHAITAGAILVRDDRTLTAFDALTGEPVWVRRRLPADFAALGTTTAAVVTGGRLGGDGLTLSARDGAVLPSPGAGTAAGKAIAAAGAAVVTVDRSGGIFDLLGAGTNTTILKGYDPAAGELRWHRVLGSDARLAVLPDAVGGPKAVLVRPARSGEEDGGDDGANGRSGRTAELLDLRTGALTPLGGTAGEEPELAAAADPLRVFLIAKPGLGAARRFNRGRVDGEAVGGAVEAFARTGGRLWRADMANTALLSAGFGRLPFAAFLAADRDVPEGDVRDTELVALDKRTGREALRAVIPTLGRFEDAAAADDGAALHLWNDSRVFLNGRVFDRPAEHWRLSVQPRVGGGE